jgi:signal transduction histidine kinase
LFTTEKVIELKSLGNEYQIEKQNIELANSKKSERKQKLINFIIIIAIVMITALMILLWFLYRRKLTVSRLLQEKNDDILKQRLKIAGQRDKLSELAFELKHTNKTKDKFFSVLAHDLKNPFQSLTGFSELLMQQIKNEDYSNALRYSEIIHETSYTTYILLENFLNWARVQTGVLKYNPEYLVLLEVVNESIEISKYTSDLKQIKIETNIEETVQIYADKYLITTTLRNLISNAVKFSNPGGVIIIDFQIEDNNYLIINVKDNGVGMKPQVLRNLFKISNYSALGTREEKGTGLGLIISKEFSILNKGDLFVTSEHGKGSTFSIKIPYHNNAN